MEEIDHQLATGVTFFSPNSAARLGSPATPWVSNTLGQGSVLTANVGSYEVIATLAM
jgi:hypothetical protein